MLKRNLIRRNQGDTTRETMIEGKVLAKVSAFFSIPKWLIITRIAGKLYSGISNKVSSGIVACFKLKIKHENLHRNNPKMPH